jgi:hypothetical protein
MPKSGHFENEITRLLQTVVFIEVAELGQRIEGGASAKDTALRRLLAAGIIEYHPRWRGCVRLTDR